MDELPRVTEMKTMPRKSLRDWNTIKCANSATSDYAEFVFDAQVYIGPVKLGMYQLHKAANTADYIGCRL